MGSLRAEIAIKSGKDWYSSILGAILVEMYRGRKEKQREREMEEL